MADNYTRPVGQVDGDGDFVPDNSLDGIITMRHSADSYTADIYTGSFVADGVYNFGVIADETYKFFVSGVERTSMGAYKHGANDAVKLTSDQTIAGVKTFSSAPVFSGGASLGGELDTNGNRIIGLDDPVTGDEPETKDSAEAKYALLSDTLTTAESDVRYPRKETGVSIQTIAARWEFSQLPMLLSDPTSAKHAANRVFVENYCQALLASINPSAYQQSGNVIRVIPSGVQETNKVYRTLSLGLSNAESFAASDRHMVIEVQGNGTGVEDADYNLLPAGTAEEYIHIIGKGEGINIRVAEATYDGVAGQNIYSNLIFDNEAEDALTNFENKIFYHCKFSNTFGSGTPVYDFVGCIFIGCTTTTDMTFDSTCKGDVYDLANDKYIIIGGIQVDGIDVIDSTGDVRPKRLQGRKGSDVASASSITLGDGNCFVITGTTTINLISVTNWQAGSRVSLFFQSNVTVNYASAPSGANIPIIWKSGANKNVLAGEMWSLVLAHDSSYWIED